MASLSSLKAKRVLDQKNEFLADLARESGLQEDCIFPRLRITHNSAKPAEVDAVILTSYNVILLELFTWSGRYSKEDNKYWRKDDSTPSPPPSTSDGTQPAAEPMASSDVRTIVVTQVGNPLTVAKHKTTALSQQLGRWRHSNFDYRVILLQADCEVLGDESRHPKLVTNSQLQSFYASLRTGWGRWFAEKMVPLWPVWLSGYTELKTKLAEMPTNDILHWKKTKEKWYGELKSCGKIPYNRSNVAELTFTERQGGYVIGKACVEVQAKKRGGRKLFERPFQLSVDSTLEFLCEEGDGPVKVKLASLSRVTLSKPIQFDA